MLYGRCCRITVKKSIEWYKVGSSGQLKMMQPLLQPVVPKGLFLSISSL